MKMFAINIQMTELMLTQKFNYAMCMSIVGSQTVTEKVGKIRMEQNLSSVYTYKTTSN